RPGVQPSAVAGGGLGAQLPRGRAAGGRLRPAAARETGRAAARAAVHPDRARLRLPVRGAVSGPRLPRRPRLPPLPGLRVRLVLAFTLVAAVTAATTGALTFREARTGVLQQSQDAVIQQLRAQVGRLAPDVAFPPGQGELGRLAVDVARADPSGSWR